MGTESNPEDQLLEPQDEELQQTPATAAPEPVDVLEPNDAGRADHGQQTPQGWAARWWQYLQHTVPETLIADGPWLAFTRLIIPMCLSIMLEYHQIEIISYGIRGYNAQVELKVQGRGVVAEVQAPPVVTAAVGGLYTSLQRAAVPEWISGPLLVHWLLVLLMPRRPGVGWRGTILRHARIFAVYLAIQVALQMVGMLMLHQIACMQLSFMDQWSCMKAAVVPSTRIPHGWNGRTTIPWAEDIIFGI